MDDGCFWRGWIQPLPKKLKLVLSEPDSGEARINAHGTAAQDADQLSIVEDDEPVRITGHDRDPSFLIERILNEVGKTRTDAGAFGDFQNTLLGEIIKDRSGIRHGGWIQHISLETEFLEVGETISIIVGFRFDQNLC